MNNTFNLNGSNIDEQWATAIKTARELSEMPRDIRPQSYYFFWEKPTETYFVLARYSDAFPTPAEVFRACRRLGYFKSNGAERYYLATEQVNDEFGRLKKLRDCEEVLYFHKAWARRDKKVTRVTFDIIGLKLQTTRLPAGVLINNVEFHFD